MKRSPDIIAFPAILPQISGNLWESKLCLLWHLLLSFWLFRNINDRSREMYPHFSRKKELMLLCYSSHFTVKINISMSSFFYLFFKSNSQLCQKKIPTCSRNCSGASTCGKCFVSLIITASTDGLTFLYASTIASPLFSASPSTI